MTSRTGFRYVVLPWWAHAIRRRQVAHQVVYPIEGFFIGVGSEMRVACQPHVCGSATEFFLRDFLAGDSFDDVRSGDKHLGFLIHHDHEIRQRG